ncbi:hypothetical protein B0H17DRAFT_961540 [Mycena rosella]|uniref:Uncharacterized protein n=1 Tax=Mycena rosella TaxID=1033263 RepID=A0AAD7BY83_MYCRO|nr:hypothetical protein B0H17DRAFT_961540 [Mycena rosella]
MENVPLFLPSTLPATQHAEGVVAHLAVIEDSMRDVQCAGALVRLHNQLHIKSHLLMYKKVHLRNQGTNMRSRTLVTRNKGKIRLHSEKYQMVWEAKRRLAGNDVTKVGWRKLAREDIRCIEDTEELLRAAATQWARCEEELHDLGELALAAIDEGDVERAPRGGENVRKVSWIWTGTGTAGTDEELEDGTWTT